MAIDRFETSLKRLEEVVKRLESGDLSMEESLKAFEEGVKHANICAAKLNEAEKKVEVLLRQKDGSFVKEPFRLDDEG